MLRLEALERDDYLCQECKKRGKITPASTVHHIAPLRVDFSKAYDLDNLETVCAACHNQLHKERGFTRDKKETNIKISRSHSVVRFFSNPELQYSPPGTKKSEQTFPGAGMGLSSR